MKWYRLKKKVLFVCVEMPAEARWQKPFFNKLAKGQAIAVSAGDRPTSKVDPKVGEVTNEIGINITWQKSKSLTAREDGKKADMVITMSCGTDTCPIVPKRVEEWKMEDPAGKPIAKFREVRNEIRKRVEKLVETLRNADK